MLTFKPYIYYTKGDSKKEIIDRVVAPSYYSALDYFVFRKQLNEEEFLNLYEVEEYETGLK
jgi:hypothetical protein